MTISESEVPIIYQKLVGLVGQKAWGVQLGVGSFLTCEFGGALAPNPEGRVHGEFHLWVRSSAWRLERLNRAIVGSEDDRENLSAGINRLEGKTLQAVEITAYTGDAVFRFEDDITLRLFNCYCQGDDEHWMVFTSDRKVLRVGPGDSWSCIDSGVP